MLLHIPDPGKQTSALGANVRFLSDPSERHPGQFGHHVCIAVNETVLLQVAISRKLAVATRALVRLLHAASVRRDRKVVEALFAPLPVHLEVLLHVLQARELPAAVGAHVPLLGVFAAVPFLLRLVRPHMLTQAHRARRRKVADRAHELFLARVRDQVRPQRRRRRVLFSAVDARVRPLAGVGAAVLHEVAGTTESLLAVRARVQLLRRVGEDVVLHCTHAGKQALAMRAGERSLTYKMQTALKSGKS